MTNSNSTATAAANKSIAAFRKLLNDLPMTKSELADLIDIPAYTVRRWARGESKPSLKNMNKALKSISDRMSEVQSKIETARDALSRHPDAAAPGGKRKGRPKGPQRGK